MSHQYQHEFMPDDDGICVKCGQGVASLFHLIGPIDATVLDRGKTHGDVEKQSSIMMGLIDAINEESDLGMFNAVQWQCIFMICNKLSRITAGDPNFKDHWHDIQGYAKLAEDSCNAD